MRSKYNVSSNKERRTFGGIVFDSELEMKYYRDVVQPKVNSGEIVKCELQKKYELQPAFKYNGKSVRQIDYVADFYLEYANGSSEVVDVKGMKTPEAQMKRKMMWYKYPDVCFRWVTYVNKTVGWVEYDEAQKIRKMNKRSKKS